MRDKVSTSSLQKINNIIDLYEDRKIVQYTTADKLIKGLSARTEKAQVKGNKAYEKAIEKHEDKERVSKKQEEALVKARDTKVKKRVEKKLSERFTPEQLKRKRKEAQKAIGQNKRRLSVQYILFSLENRSGAKKASFTYEGNKYYPLLVNPAVRMANVKADRQFMESNVKRKIARSDNKPLFKKMMLAMRSDKSFEEMLEKPFYHYIDMIRLESVDEIDGDGEYNVFDEDLTNTNNLSIFNRYVETEVDVEALTIKEAIMKKEYVENECWINTLYDHYADTLMRDKRGALAKNLTRENILKLINKTDEEFKQNGASIRDMSKVFEKYNIKARLYDVDGVMIYKYEPPNFNSKRVPTFNGLIKNNHIYTINDNLTSLKAKSQGDNYFDIRISNNFHINNRETPIEYKMIENINEILQLRQEDEYNLILEDNDLTKSVYHLKQSGYEPDIRWEAGRITELRVKLKYKIDKRKFKVIIYNVKTQSLGRGRVDEDVAVSAEETFNTVNRAFFDFNKVIFNEAHKSFYNDVDVQVLDECRTIIPHGSFKKIINGENIIVEDSDIREIDCCKAFTKAFTEIIKVPVFRECDVWRPMSLKEDINKMNDYTLYIVKACQGNVFFNKVFNLVYGKILKELIKDGVVCKVLYYKIPAYTYKVDYQNLVDELWAKDLSDDIDEDKRLKKHIANINFGLMEKSENKKSKSRMYDNLNEALHKQKIHGGKVFAINECEMEEVDTWKPMTGNVCIETEEDGHQCINDNCQIIDEYELMEKDGITYYRDTFPEKEYYEKNRDVKYYVLDVSDSRTLTNGFRYIKELLLQNHNIRMYKALKALKENNVRVYSVKTDAFHIHADDKKKAKKALEFHNGIGGWRLENKYLKSVWEKYSWKYNALPTIPIFENKQLEIEDEWDAMSICQTILPYKRCLITAKFAGSGKSFICQQFEKLGYRTLFVVPQNMLTQEIDGKATTLNKFFSIPVHKGDELPYFDHSEFSAIVFDEIFMANPYVQHKIFKFIKDNPDKIVIGAGDVKQLPSIQEVSNTQPADEYMNNCLNITFKHSIFLKICKRVGEEDRIRMNEMYDDLWVRKIAINEWIHKYFKMTDDVMKSENNIAYTNLRCQAVSSEIRKRLGKKEKYEIGEVMICRLYRDDKEGKFNVNIRWKIDSKKWDSQARIYKYRIQDIKNTEDVRTVDEYVLDNHFRYAYCATTHSRQGASISGNITIHEWNKTYLMSREWLWCSITRARDLNKVYFFKNDKCNDDMEKGLILDYFKNKVEGYKRQDRKAKRNISEEDYIDVKWCVRHFKECCGRCGVKFDFDRKGGKLTSNFTAQRLDNETEHTEDNCVAYCLDCNRIAG